MRYSMDWWKMVEGKIYRKTPYLMGKYWKIPMVSCRFSLQPIHRDMIYCAYMGYKKGRQWI
jgi:hypothetical protein